MQQLGQYHMYSMQFEGILNSTTRILSRLDDNVNSSRYIIQVILSFYLFSKMEMKRVDFLYGVIFLSIVLLLPLFLQVYGYLDAQTYIVHVRFSYS